MDDYQYLCTFYSAFCPKGCRSFDSGRFLILTFMTSNWVYRRLVPFLFNLYFNQDRMPPNVLFSAAKSKLRFNQIISKGNAKVFRFFFLSV